MKKNEKAAVDAMDRMEALMSAGEYVAAHAAGVEAAAHLDAVLAARPDNRAAQECSLLVVKMLAQCAKATAA